MGWKKYYFLGGPVSKDLKYFSDKLIAIVDGKANINYRSEATKTRYLIHLKKLGVMGVDALIRRRMGGKKTALLTNDFPYDGIIPQKSHLKHYCLWSLDEAKLTTQFIDTTIKGELFGKPALVFMHDGHLSSIKTIPHVHIVADMGETDKETLAKNK